MNYLYYPGCSLHGTAREYDRSTRALMAAMGDELTELKDWTCCGASAAEASSRLLSYALPAVNLAIAEQMTADMDTSADLMVPCSACYLNLKKTTEAVRKSPEFLDTLNSILAEKEMAFKGRTKVRHLLDVLSADTGADAVKEHVTMDLSHLTIAPYYGCQCLRPYPVFDDPEAPVSMDALIRATGAAVHTWDMGAKCCGASHMNTKMEVAQSLVYNILKAAQGADAIVTVCPMCQMNLEAYQHSIAKKFGEYLDMTILYLPQFLGLAMGLSEKDLGLEDNLALTHLFRYKMQKAVNM